MSASSTENGAEKRVQHGYFKYLFGWETHLELRTHSRRLEIGERVNSDLVLSSYSSTVVHKGFGNLKLPLTICENLTPAI